MNRYVVIAPEQAPSAMAGLSVGQGMRPLHAAVWRGFRMPLRPSSGNECRTAADRESTETREYSGSLVPLEKERARRVVRLKRPPHFRRAREIAQRNTSPRRPLVRRSSAPREWINLGHQKIPPGHANSGLCFCPTTGKVFTDHVIWEQSLGAFGRDASLAAT
jgi:hypothetical protein